MPTPSPSPSKSIVQRDIANSEAALQDGETPEARKTRVLAAIEDGSLAKSGVTRLDLSGCDLARLPEKIGALTSLEFLNLGDNPLSSLPESFDGLVNLRVLFFLRCEFVAVPVVLGRMKSLFMLSFKANRVRDVPEGCLPPSLGWLILSDNEIEKLPACIGECVGIRKLLLAGNKLTNAGLPDGMKNLRQLELLRIADNELTSVPEWLANHDALAWVALAANPVAAPWAADAEKRAKATATVPPHVHGTIGREHTNMAALVPVPEVPTLAFESLRVDESETPLGRGASGAVYPGLWLKEEPLNAYDSCPNVYRVVPTPAAVKVYNHGAKTSDGRPKDEMHASILASKTGCKSIVRTIATFQKEWTLRNERDGFPEEGLVMEFLEQDEWVSLGSPPSFDSVTRDTYSSNVTRSRGEIVEVARGVAAAGAALHGAGVCHGDLYAHNIMFRSDAVGRAHSRPKPPAAKLSDFGAAFFYPPGSEIGRAFERIEARAFGILLQELLSRHDGKDDGGGSVTIDALREMVKECVGPREKRPTFADISSRLGAPKGV